MKESKFITLSQSKLREKLYKDIEEQSPSIWTIVYGDKAKEQYEKYLREKIEDAETTITIQPRTREDAERLNKFLLNREYEMMFGK